MNGSTLATPSGYLRQHADDEHDCTDDDAGGDGLAGAADGERDDDECDADCVVGDGVEPRRKQANERHE